MRIHLLLACATLSGCTTTELPIQKITPGTTAFGYPHRLKFTQFEIPVTWRIVSCDDAKSPPMKIKISAEPKEKATPDPDQFYVIDPRGLQGAFRNTEFAMEWYDDRSTKSINSTVDDQTATAITDVLTGVAKLAAVGLVPGGPQGGACPKKVTDALDAINGVKGKPGQEAITKNAQQAVDEQQAVVTRLTEKASGDDKKAKAQLAEAQDALETLTATLDEESAKLKELVEKVSETRTFVWPPTNSEYDSSTEKPYEPTKKAVAEWGADSTAKAWAVFFGLRPLEGGPVVPASPTNDEGKSAKDKQPWLLGLPYREPRLMRLYVCSGKPCAADRSQLDDNEDVVKASDVQVLQAGTMFYLPFTARTFASIKSSAGFSQAGVLTSAGTQQTRGAGLGVTGAFKGGAEQVAAIVTGERSAETARLQARTQELKAKKELQDAEAALGPAADADEQAAIKAFQTDATLATAERAKIEAEQALIAAKAQLAK